GAEPSAAAVGESVGDYDPALPALKPYYFDAIQGFFGPAMEPSVTFKLQYGADDLPAMPAPEPYVAEKYGLFMHMVFENDTDLDPVHFVDHWRVRTTVLDGISWETRAYPECEREAHCEVDVDLGTVLTGSWNPATPEQAAVEFLLQYWHSPEWPWEDGYWVTLGSLRSVLDLTSGGFISTVGLTGPCSAGDWCEFVPLPNGVRYRAADGVVFYDELDVSWNFTTIPYVPPSPEVPPPAEI